MKNMRTPLIFSALEKYAEAGAVRFHMPGHKGRGERYASFNVERDITELSFSGCLSADSGIVFEAEKNIAEILSARRSHIVTDGSTAAVLAMIFVASTRGKKLIIPRESHKSVYNGLRIFGMEPLFLPSAECDCGNISDVGKIEKILEQNPDAAGAMLVSPDYYGRVQDMRSARKILSAKGKLLFIDGAHGAHLKFCNEKLYAGTYADIWADGLHKTLPCLTQGALLNINNEEILSAAETGLDLFRTTSPSYPIMASCEAGVYMAEAFGKSGFERLYGFSRAFKKKAEAAGYVFYDTEDEAKIVLDCARSGVAADKLFSALEKDGVFAEFSDGRYIVMMISQNTEEKDFLRALSSLEKYGGENEKISVNVRKRALNKFPERAMSYVSAINAEYETVECDRAAGRIAACNMGFFPPCFPAIAAGERIDGETAFLLSSAENAFGLRGGKFKVVKEK